MSHRRFSTSLDRADVNGGLCSATRERGRINMVQDYEAVFAVVPRATVEITRRCNLRCAHCYSTHGPNSITNERAEHLFAQLASMGVLEVCLTGGEPLLAKNWTDLMHIAASRHLLISMITNGTLVDASLACRFSKYASVATVSLYATSDEDYESYTGFRDGFQRVSSALACLARSGIKTPLSVLPQNCPLDTLVPFILKHPARESIPYIGLIYPKKYRFRFPRTPVSYVDYAIELTERTGIMASVSAPACCPILIGKANSVHVDISGSVKPCPYIPFSIGAIELLSKYELTSNHLMTGLKGYLAETMPCEDCDSCVAFRERGRYH
jgi:MoaA/NifB/PqqE/SkfB family radical SAM enzyme